MSEKTVAGARDLESARRKFMIVHRDAEPETHIEFLADGLLSLCAFLESLAAQPKAEHGCPPHRFFGENPFCQNSGCVFKKGEPSGEASEPLPFFMGLPDRWHDGRKFRCKNGHVSTTLLKHSIKGNVCLGCYEPVLMTFPEDEDGNMLGAEVFTIRWAHWRSTQAATTATDAGTGDASTREGEAQATREGSGSAEHQDTNRDAAVCPGSPVPVHPSVAPRAEGPSALYLSRLFREAADRTGENHDGRMALYNAGKEAGERAERERNKRRIEELELAVHYHRDIESKAEHRSGFEACRRGLAEAFANMPAVSKAIAEFELEQSPRRATFRS